MQENNDKNPAAVHWSSLAVGQKHQFLASLQVSAQYGFPHRKQEKMPKIGATVFL